MNIEDIFLTEDEQSQAIQQGAEGWFALLNTPNGHKFLADTSKEICKDQCLKMLRSLTSEENYCKNHTHENIGCYIFSCPDCVAELEKRLMEREVNEEILLTDEEIGETVTGDDWDEDCYLVCKDQCLKMLEWGKEKCNIWKHNLDGDFSHLRFECSECLNELEKWLKIGQK